MNRFTPLQTILFRVEQITTILTNPSFLLKFLTTHFRHVSAYYQVVFNTDEQFLFYNFIMILERNRLTRLNKLMRKKLKVVRRLYQIGINVQNYYSYLMMVCLT